MFAYSPLLLQSSLQTLQVNFLAVALVGLEPADLIVTIANTTYRSVPVSLPDSRLFSSSGVYAVPASFDYVLKAPYVVSTSIAETGPAFALVGEVFEIEAGISMPRGIPF
jgi:hypothetical protein